MQEGRGAYSPAYLLKLLLVLVVVLHARAVQAFFPQESYWLWGCPGSALKGESECLTGVVQVRSITVYSTVNTNAIVESGADCSQFSQHHQCSRRITTSDTGLSDSYRYFYNWILSKCDGKNKCDDVEVPQWWDLIGETNNPIELEYKNGTTGYADCPQAGTKYTSGVFVHVSCRVDVDISTRSAPAPTTPRTRPTSPQDTNMASNKVQGGGTLLVVVMTFLLTLTY